MFVWVDVIYFAFLITGDHKTEEYKKITETTKVPAMQDGDFCLAERYIHLWAWCIIIIIIIIIIVNLLSQHCHLAVPGREVSDS